MSNDRFHEKVNQLKEEVNNFPDSASEEVIEKTAVRLEGLNVTVHRHFNHP